MSQIAVVGRNTAILPQVPARITECYLQITLPHCMDFNWMLFNAFLHFWYTFSGITED
jgi:hypothetical protein